MVLAVLAVCGGALSLPAVLHARNLLEEWLAPVLERGDAILAAQAAVPQPLSTTIEWTLLGLGALIALVFAHRAFHAYEAGPAFDAGLERKQPKASGFLADAWGVDALYRRCVVQPIVL